MDSSLNVGTYNLGLSLEAKLFDRNLEFVSRTELDLGVEAKV